MTGDFASAPPADGRSRQDGADSQPATQQSAEQVFGVGLPLARRYAALLAGPGVLRGLIGPRESDRIWQRHLLNCAVIEELLPPDARIVDVGTGAGLPGLALACARSDLRVDLVDSLRRRTDFLTEVVDDLTVGNRVRVVTGRVEDAAVRATVGQARWVTARAVAPLDRLARWCLPLLEPGGQVLAMKGRRADEEAATHTHAITRAGGSIVDVVRCGVGRVSEPPRVVRILKR